MKIRFVIIINIALASIVILSVVLGLIPIYMYEEKTTRIPRIRITKVTSNQNQTTLRQFKIQQTTTSNRNDDASEISTTVRSTTTASLNDFMVVVIESLGLKREDMLKILSKGDDITPAEQQIVRDYIEKVRNNVDRFLKNKILKQSTNTIRKRSLSIEELSNFTTENIEIKIKDESILLMTYSLVKKKVTIDDALLFQNYMINILTKNDTYVGLEIDILTTVQWFNPTFSLVNIDSESTTTTTTTTTTSTSTSTTTTTTTSTSTSTTTTTTTTTTTSTSTSTTTTTTTTTTSTSTSTTTTTTTSTSTSTTTTTTTSTSTSTTTTTTTTSTSTSTTTTTTTTTTTMTTSTSTIFSTSTVSSSTSTVEFSTSLALSTSTAVNRFQSQPFGAIQYNQVNFTVIFYPDSNTNLTEIKVYHATYIHGMDFLYSDNSIISVGYKIGAVSSVDSVAKKIRIVRVDAVAWLDSIQFCYSQNDCSTKFGGNSTEYEFNLDLLANANDYRIYGLSGSSIDYNDIGNWNVNVLNSIQVLYERL